jgi:hypothetical protein
LLCDRQSFAFGQQLPGQFVRLLAVVSARLPEPAAVTGSVWPCRHPFFALNLVIVERLLDGSCRVVRRLYISTHLAGDLNTNPDPANRISAIATSQGAAV